MSIEELQSVQQPIEIQQLFAQIAEVKASLLGTNPNLGKALSEIHKMLLSHEELTHMVGDEDWKAIHSAMEKYKQVQVVTNATKNSGKKISDKKLMDL